VQQKQQQQQYRDPFEIFDSVMKVDYGDNYKKEIEKWMARCTGYTMI
ncbi:MAG: hypothetical protein ACI90V_013935, partial [Bacillariaceae sp.]|jgi:hypothetical protein